MIDRNEMESEVHVAPYIEGELIPSAADAAVDVINPSNGQRVFSIPSGCASDVDRAVMSARKAFEDGRWSETPPSKRKRTLHLFADLIEAEGELLNRLDAAEMGKPVAESFGNASAAARLMRFYAEALDKTVGDVYVSDANSYVTQRRVPRGVVAAIVPWNFPTYVTVLKLGPALAVGNSVVLKPSEFSSRSAVRLVQLALQAGLPPGVFNLVPGLGQTVGRALGLHNDVDMLTFTGSTRVGKELLQYAGQSNMKVVMAECGGKSPHIVFGDVENPAAIGEAIARSLVVNQGQICSVGSRLLVHTSIQRQVLEALAAQTRRVVIGDALDYRTTFGPIVSKKQCAGIVQHIESACADGAEVYAGGRRVLEQTGGNFVEPTVLCNVAPAARIAQEEVFGPVLAVIPFKSEEEAIRIANGTMYGLAAYAWTANLATGMRVAKSVRSSIWINTAPPTGERAGHAASFEPFGQSGVGTEGGVAGMESYQRRQLVGINYPAANSFPSAAGVRA